MAPASPRWLATTGRIKEAKLVFDRIAKCNKKPCISLEEIEEVKILWRFFVIFLKINASSKKHHKELNLTLNLVSSQITLENLKLLVTENSRNFRFPEVTFRNLSIFWAKLN